MPTATTTKEDSSSKMGQHHPHDFTKRRKTVVSVMAYLPSMESGGVDTTTIRHLIPSCRHQLSSITLYLTDVLERIVSGQTKSHQLHELLAWNWKAARERAAQAAA
jgi:hypothetical protein